MNGVMIYMKSLSEYPDNPNSPHKFIVSAHYCGTQCQVSLFFEDGNTLNMHAGFSKSVPYPVVTLQSAKRVAENISLADINLECGEASLPASSFLADSVSAPPPLWPESVIKSWHSWPSKVHNELRKSGWSLRACQKITRTPEWKEWKEKRDPVILLSISKLMPSMLSTMPSAGGTDEWPGVSVVVDEGEYVPGVFHDGVEEYHISKSKLFNGPLILTKQEMGRMKCIIRDEQDFQKGEFWQITPDDSETSFIIGKLNGEDATTIQAIIYPESLSKADAMTDCDNHSGTLVEATGDGLERSVGGSTTLPLADRKRAWDATAAEKRVRAWAGGAPNARYERAFFYYDAANKENLTSYKLQFADVIDGVLTAIPRGIFAVAAALRGSRGGVNIPDSDKAKIKAKVATYYAKMRKEFNDPSIVVPWSA